MNSVNVPTGIEVYTRLNNAYTRLLEKKILSSDDRLALAVFFEHMSRDHHDYHSAVYLEDTAAKFRKGIILSIYDRDLVLAYLLGALNSACVVLRNCGVEVHDQNQAAA